MGLIPSFMVKNKTMRRDAQTEYSAAYAWNLNLNNGNMNNNTKATNKNYVRAVSALRTEINKK